MADEKHSDMTPLKFFLCLFITLLIFTGTVKLLSTYLPAIKKPA